VTTGFRSSDKLAKVLYQAAPLIMTGLSVGFAFKTGLFNIGATGQYTVGAVMALIGAIQFQLPWYVCLLLAMIGGAFWGIFPGLFKALFNVNEVITSIMFNWIGMFSMNLIINNMPMMLAKFWGGAQMDRTASLLQANPNALIPRLGLDVLMKSNFMNTSIFIAIIFALIAWVILSKTTFGYELKACGYNRSASMYAGINAKRNIVLSMVISGAFAGIGGGLYYLAGTGQYTLIKALLTAGFNGIPVALLATSNPIGTIFSALFVSYIQVGGDAMQPDFVREIIDIIISVIIYLSAFALLTRELLARGKQRREEEAAAIVAPETDEKDEGANS
jgi:simple sugar transport system permease protein